MRYFKFKNGSKCEGNVMKEHYKSLTKDEQATLRKHKFWIVLYVITMLAILFTVMTVGSLLLKQIPHADNEWLEVLRIFGIIFGLFVFLTISAMLMGVVSLPFQKKAASYDLPFIKKEILTKGCEYLRKYYGLDLPYIVTKCYDCSDPRFKDHDVCIFISDGELRITTDIMRGFLHGERDLGCYAFRREEIRLSQRDHNGLRAVELQVINNVDNPVVFLLCHRASGFIKKIFLHSQVERR